MPNSSPALPKQPGEVSIDARDNPPTVTARDGEAKTDRTIDIAYDYIARLETDLKAKNNEHQFLRSRLDRALEKKNHPSVGSWQNTSEAGGVGDLLHEEFEGAVYQTKQTLTHDKPPAVINLKLPIHFLKGNPDLSGLYGGPSHQVNQDLLSLKFSRPSTALPKKKLASQYFHTSTQAGTSAKH